MCGKIMKTRSKSAQLLKQTKDTFTAAFFDESSKCWMENKKRKKNGDYVYKPEKRNAMKSNKVIKKRIVNSMCLVANE
jgi:hypothetical protein